MNIAIFADIHGRILLCFKLVERFEQETGEKVALILQCGDMGIFPDLSRLDKATIRHAEKDPTELGFSKHFHKPSPEVQKVLEKTCCNLISIRGNHEDHRFLDEIEDRTANAVFPVDCYKRVFILRTGMPYTYRSGENSVRLLGIGRIGKPDSGRAKQGEKYIQEYESSRLLNLNRQEIDILLTHDSARDFITRGFGMIEIRMVLDEHRPVFHFFGHTGQPFESRLDANGFTGAAKMSDLEFRHRDGTLEPGCFGLLKWQNRNNHSLEVIETPWLHEYTRETWQYL